MHALVVGFNWINLRSAFAIVNNPQPTTPTCFSILILLILSLQQCNDVHDLSWYNYAESYTSTYFPLSVAVIATDVKQLY